MRALERSYDVFVDKGIIPLGINVDHKFSKEAWGKVINVEKLDMLSDYNPLGGTAKAYGLYNEDMAASNRANILIDEEGKVEWVEVYPPGVLPDFDEVLEAIENL